MANIDTVPREESPVPPQVPLEAAPPQAKEPFEALARDQVADMLRLPHFGRWGALMVAGILVFLWAASGFYRVQPDEQGIVLRFGKWVSTQASGVHYHWPYPIETVLLPKTTQINQLVIGKRDGSRERNQILTGDENIVEAEGVVFWRIRDAGQFLFKVADSEGTLRVAAESALREVIGQNPIQSALSDKRQQIAQQTEVVLQRLLDKYEAGITITQVQLLRIDPPPAVIDAFNDVQRARADQERARNEAEAYRNDILPHARGEAEHITQEAAAYGEQVVDLARGEAQSFLAVAAAYERHKDVTLRRLYLEGVDELLKRSGRVIVELSAHGGGVVPYLPLMEPGPKPAAVAEAPVAGAVK
ncbi:FtsH protease activity modulator HflK [Xanthobacter sp. DSM 14520]|uniref:FtsH protease activity modulator HflK n=1 Tax=Xanthobacter autotrophicus (strain ATCC BAA-1158 / Py2) TaxID=78245 RepID=UPI003728005C